MCCIDCRYVALISGNCNTVSKHAIQKILTSVFQKPKSLRNLNRTKHKDSQRIVAGRNVIRKTATQIANRKNL